MIQSSVNYMSQVICRLCLNNSKLIDLFDERLTNSEQLRKCVLLGTGVEICPDDFVTKFICKNCSDIAIFLYKYRQEAIANDKALKKLVHQKFVEPSNHTDEIVKFNHQLVELIKNEETKEKEEEKIKPVDKKKTFCSSPAVHSTIIKLIKSYPRLKIPNHILKCDIQPNVALNREEAENWIPPIKTPKVRRPISDIELFKLKCPGIAIMKISHSTENKDDEIKEKKPEICMYENFDKAPKIPEIKEQNKGVIAIRETVETPKPKSKKPEDRNLHISRNVMMKKPCPSGVKAENINNKKIPEAIEAKISEIIEDLAMTSNPKATKSPENTGHNSEVPRIVLVKTPRGVEVKNADNEISKPAKVSEKVQDIDATLEKYLTIPPTVEKKVNDVPANVKKRKSTDSPNDSARKKKKVNQKIPLIPEVKRTYPPATGALQKEASRLRTILPKPPASETRNDVIANVLSTPPTNRSESNVLEVTSKIDTAKVASEQKTLESLDTDDEQIKPKKLSHNIFDSDQSDNESIGANDTCDMMEDNIVTVEEEVAFHCRYCNKLYKTQLALKCHERTHRYCTICKGIFRNDEALSKHQNDMCFKSVIVNPPKLQLTRVDEQPDMLKRYSAALTCKIDKAVSAVSTTSGSTQDVFCISDDDDDDVILVPSDKSVPQRVEDHPEYKQIKAIFKKYWFIKFPEAYKNRYTMTKPHVFIKHNVKKQIVLENMYSELRSYRVPVELSATENSFAIISFKKKPPVVKDMYNWSKDPVSVLSEKTIVIPDDPSPATTSNGVVSNNVTPVTSTGKAQIVGNAASSVSDAQPSTETSFSLRVKALWELNTI